MEPKTKVKHHNKGYNILFTLIEITTRVGYVYPIKTKG